VAPLALPERHGNEEIEMATGLPSDQYVTAALAEAVQRQLIEALEPALEQAVEKFRDAARKRLAEIVVGAIQSNYSVERMGQVIHISVKLG
jgi:diphthamide synthase (EF-2-diphthine--ammonia ligase)